MKKQTILYILTIALINATLLSNNDVVVTAKEEGFSAFHDLVMNAGLYEHAKKEIGASGSLAPFTVFVPTNEAFKSIESYSEKKKKQCITYHVVPGKKIESTEKLMDEMKSGIPTVGEKLIFAADNKIFLDESPVKASIIKGPIQANNGVLYVIDHVLLPDGEKPEKAEISANQKEEHSSDKPAPKVVESTATVSSTEIIPTQKAPTTQAPIQLVMPMQIPQQQTVTEETAQQLCSTMMQLTQSIQLLIHVIQQAQNPTDQAEAKVAPSPVAKPPVVVV